VRSIEAGDSVAINGLCDWLLEHDQPALAANLTRMARKSWKLKSGRLSQQNQGRLNFARSVRRHYAALDAHPVLFAFKDFDSIAPAPHDVRAQAVYRAGYAREVLKGFGINGVSITVAPHGWCRVVVPWRLDFIRGGSVFDLDSDSSIDPICDTNRRASRIVFEILTRMKTLFF
jgi:riboflavin synthase alpha subunit